MSKPLVFVTRRVPQEGIDLLKEKCEVSLWDSDDVIPRDVLLVKVRGTSGIFCTINDEIDEAVLEAAGPHLKVIGTMSVGTDHIDQRRCDEKNIYVARTPDVASDSAAELSIALILITTRRIAEGLEAIKAGEVNSWKPMWLLGHTVMGKTLGILGFGRVGFGIARRMKPFGLSRIIYNDVFHASYADGIADFVSFDELLEQSDILCICCAVTPQTVGLFNLDTFMKMKKNAILINTARGAIVNHDDLHNALTTNLIGGAGLDVTNPEPLPVTHPLKTMPNCVILPHLGTNTWEARTLMSINTAKNILASLNLA